MEYLLEEVLGKKERIVIAPSGGSMLPLIREGKDTVVLKQRKGLVSKYEVVLYKRKNGVYVLHRILDVRPDGYVLCGDNQCVLEYGVKEEQILGIMEGFYRGEHYVDVQSCKGYIRYVKVWCFSLKLRKILLFFIRIKKKILPEKKES